MNFCKYCIYCTTKTGVECCTAPKFKKTIDPVTREIPETYCSTVRTVQLSPTEDCPEYVQRPIDYIDPEKHSCEWELRQKGFKTIRIKDYDNMLNTMVPKPKINWHTIGSCVISGSIFLAIFYLIVSSLPCK